MIHKNDLAGQEGQNSPGGLPPRAGLFVVSAPSGAGKTTLCTRMLKLFPGLSYSISHTTRPPRGNEKDGVDYFFITPEVFRERIQKNAWAEWAKVHDNYYGTSRAFITERLEKGNPLLLDIDVQGARQIRKTYPRAVTVFINAPSMAVLEARLRKRGTDSDVVIARRLENAAREMADLPLYDHVIVNDDLDTAAGKMAAIIEKFKGGAV
ncbi:guanylate kinase [Desulfocicer vacuolatum DSM 3385]|uniref:Guanylate kinase n=1 Tax=Desulfocicer vacuolatum DSM 3385 TaxID=1121400 RepID=A0A1W1Z7V2_9BACT|nr:guanylate kinase [Desulfocicer vacuolatum]SMC44529.1 guanylate kinase [Desulfocicer vacuolatum DSM 3385]